MERIFLKGHLLLLLLLIVSNVNGQPSGVPKESFPDYFTYFDPGSADKPPGSDTARKAIFYYELPNSSGTFSLIYTDRTDDSICACMAGHQIAKFFPGAVALGSFSKIWDVYTDYLGADSTATINGTTYHLNKYFGFSKGVLTGGNLVAYYYNPAVATASDIALVLIDKRQLPGNTLSTLGYDINRLNWTASDYYSVTSDYYSVSYPHSYPQRLQDEYEITVNGNELVWVLTSLPFSAAPGSSGAPLIKRPQTPAESWFMRGVMSTANYVDGEVVHDRLLNENFKYSYEQGFTKIGMIADEIKRHCWKNQDATYIITNGLHMKPTVIDNAANMEPYSLKRTISSASGIKESAINSPLPEKRILVSYLKADQCNMSGFTLPAIYPGDILDWQVIVAAKEINVNPGFDYKATDLSELALTTVAMNARATSSTARMFENAAQPPLVTDQETATLFKVWPNPSPTGLFQISFPPTGHYRLVINNVEGKEIYRADCSGNLCSFQMPAGAFGTYFLQLYAAETNRVVYRQRIIY